MKRKRIKTWQLFSHFCHNLKANTIDTSPKKKKRKEKKKKKKKKKKEKKKKKKYNEIKLDNPQKALSSR